MFWHFFVLSSLTTGASVQLTGRLVPSPGQEQQHELQVEQLQLLGECDSVSTPILFYTLSATYTSPHSRPALVDIPIAEEKTYHGVPPWDRPLAIQRKHRQCCSAIEKLGSAWLSKVLRGMRDVCSTQFYAFGLTNVNPASRMCERTYAHYHIAWLWRRWRSIQGSTSFRLQPSTITECHCSVRVFQEACLFDCFRAITRWNSRIITW